MFAFFSFFWIACRQPPDPIDQAPKPPAVENVHNLWPENKPIKYLLSFHTCDTKKVDCSDPWMHQTFVAASENGFSWGLLARIPGFASSVPDLILRDDILYLYALPRQQRVEFSTGKLLPQRRVEVLDSAGKRVMNVDPSAILDENGRIVLFFLVGAVGVDPATCPPHQHNCTKVFRSATEVKGSDGTRFLLDSGVRAKVKVDHRARFASDPDIFTGPDGYYMYISRGQGTQVLFSKTLRGEYKPIQTLPEGMLTRENGGVGAGHYDEATGRFWAFLTKHRGGQQHMKMTEIRFVSMNNFQSSPQPQSFRTMLQGKDFFTSAYLVASPGFFAIPEVKQ